MAATLRVLGAAALAALPGCGGLESPDVATGSVGGRIAGGAGGAYAYVFGRPDLFAAATADGSFRLDRVPAGEQALVLFDGSAGAKLERVRVRSADLVDLGTAGPLPPASRVVAAASPLSGALPTNLRFSVDDTVLSDAPVSPTAAQLFPLPAGRFVLRGRQPGYREGVALVDVPAGATVPVELALEVEDGDENRGCLSAGCEPWLRCDAADGRCYPCVAGSDCASGVCTPDHLCAPAGGGGTGVTCDSCTLGGADCQGLCWDRNDHGDPVPPYCTVACPGGSAAECPAGFECDGSSSVCVPELSCVSYAATFGAPCLKDDTCKAALHDGSCRPSAPGVCSARAQAGCPAGWTVDGDGYCAPP